jgi:CHASE2 domain-containing sensor protein
LAGDIRSMSKRALLRCDGAIESGFRIVLELSEPNAPVFTEATGALPAAVELFDLFSQWQQAYYQSLGTSRIALESVTVKTGRFTQISTCKSIEQQLKSAFKSWLSAPEFQPIDRRLREVISPHEPVEMLLRSTDLRLHRLPWHFWEFIERYPQAELLISSPSERLHLPDRQNAKVRILAIFGDRRGIDTSRDLQAIANIKNADVLTLVEPTRHELHTQLWERDWEILFFAGHSKTEQQEGRIYLNPTESLTLDELRFGLQRAIARGLQLTLFNSCDGLGLAYELERLHIPHSIVMRLPVPDRVAQEFLDRFLNAFLGGKSLHLSVREARESLQGLEGEFPAASWLPIVFQNPAAPPLIAADLHSPVPLVHPQVGRWRSSIVAMAVTGLVLGSRYLGILQPIELSAYDLLIRSRPAEQPDKRLLIVTVTEADIQAQSYEREPRRGSLSDRSLTKLLAKLIPAKPAAIGLDIYRDYPVSNTESSLRDRLKTTDNIFGVCKVSDTATGDPGVAPPPEIERDRLGFSDILLDPDRLVRRHYLAFTPPPVSQCQSSYALSVQLALHYLATKQIVLEYLPNDVWKLGKLQFAPIENHRGGYQKIAASGHQILLNYRATPTVLEVAPTVTLQDVLAGKISNEAIADRIVLIGTTAPSFNDSQLVPYATDRGEIQSIPGVVLQAQMVSQLLGAALDGRALIQSYPWWVDLLWIGGCAATGGMLVTSCRRPIAVGVGTIVLLSGVGFLRLQSGDWVPIVPATIAIVGSMGTTLLIDRSRQDEG